MNEDRITALEELVQKQQEDIDALKRLAGAITPKMLIYKFPTRDSFNKALESIWELGENTRVVYIADIDDTIKIGELYKMAFEKLLKRRKLSFTIQE